MNDLFVQYFKEREDLTSIVHEFGFLTYVIYIDNGSKLALLNDFFVVKSERGKGHGKALFQTFLNAVRQQGCNRIVCKIAIDDPNSRSTLQMALSNGFNVIRAEDGTITIYRSFGDNG